MTCFTCSEPPPARFFLLFYSAPEPQNPGSQLSRRAPRGQAKPGTGSGSAPCSPLSEEHQQQCPGQVPTNSNNPPTVMPWSTIYKEHCPVQQCTGQKLGIAVCRLLPGHSYL